MREEAEEAEKQSEVKWKAVGESQRTYAHAATLFFVCETNAAHVIQPRAHTQAHAITRHHTHTHIHLLFPSPCGTYAALVVEEPVRARLKSDKAGQTGLDGPHILAVAPTLTITVGRNV